jgi:two-component system sensor histidine kinase DesK
MRLIPNDSNLGWTPYAWLVYIVPFAVTPLLSRSQTSLAHWALYITATLFFVVIYLRSHWAQGRELILLTALTLAMGLGFWPISYGAGAFFIYAASMIGCSDDSRIAIRGVALIAIITIIQAIVLRRDLISASWPVVFVIIIGAINIHYSSVGRANARLRLAHDEIEHLAKVAERERIARDLHDLLGHTLSLVILKSELAAKIAERDPARAGREIQDVERIARDALAQVRAAVTGYRSGSLETELQHAASALATAGVTLDSASPPRVPPPQEAVLTLALREAVTNIVRHARASHCVVAFGIENEECLMTVTDDGRGGQAPFGSGLSGMRERVAALGGSVERDGSRGSRLTVRLPLKTLTVERSA